MKYFLVLLLLITHPISTTFGAQVDDSFSKPIVSWPQSFVTGTIGGQLGNQIFVVAATLAYAWDHNAHPLFPDFSISSEFATQYKLAFNRENFFFRLDISNPPWPFSNTYIEPRVYWTEPLPAKRDIRLTGSFQSLNYFHHRRNELLDVFAPSAAILSELQAKYSDLIAMPNTVSVHIRTYDEKNHNAGLYFLGLDYYRTAMNLFPKDTTFVIFSDRINWCKVHFAKFNKNMVFIEGNDPVEDVILMSLMKNHIISNSSFAWWGAYLDPRAEKIVVAPEYWLHPWIQPTIRPNLFLQEWIRVPANLYEPYPTDIRDYDEQSLSIDTQ